jgi:hypothetical protein
MCCTWPGFVLQCSFCHLPALLIIIILCPSAMITNTDTRFHGVRLLNCLLSALGSSSRAYILASIRTHQFTSAQTSAMVPQRWITIGLSTLRDLLHTSKEAVGAIHICTKPDLKTLVVVNMVIFKVPQCVLHIRHRITHIPPRRLGMSRFIRTLAC